MNRGSQAPFMTKELSKQIMIRSRLRNKFSKHRTREHWETIHASETKMTLLDSTTATGIDTIPPKLVKMARDIIEEQLTNLINSTLINCQLFPLRKSCNHDSSLQKDDKLSKKNYRSTSVLNVFSKVFERYILNQMMPFFDKIRSKLILLIDLDTVRSMYF